MATAKILKSESLRDFVGVIQSEQAGRDRELWFRGCSDSDYELLPSLYRHPTVKSIDEYAKLEKGLATRFNQRSIPFHSRTLEDGWDAMFFMQHFGVPTRLLDWSENPFVALYFAVIGSARTRGAVPRDAVVWILDTAKWNQHSLRGQSFKGGILSSNDPSVSAYLSLEQHATMPNAPLAMYGAHNSQRIVAQRGVFTVFGKSAKPMEAAFDAEGYPASALIKVVLPGDKVRDLRDQVLANGVTESVVMPDLDGLAREIRRQHGFVA